MARRTPTPTNLIDKRTGETHVFPSRGAARAYRQEHGTANFRTSEYIQRIVRLETARPGISRTEARGHATSKPTEGQKPGQYRRGRGAKLNPTIYGVSSGADSRSIDAKGIAEMRGQLGKTKSKYVLVSIRAKWAGGAVAGDMSVGRKSKSPDVIPIPAGDLGDPPVGTKYSQSSMWVGRTRDRSQVENALKILDIEARSKQFGPIEALNRFAWRMGLAPAIKVSQVTFQEMPG